MAVVTLVGSRIMDLLDNTPRALGAPGTGGGRVQVWCETVEATASNSESSTYLLAELPSNARILGSSKIYWDDLTTDASSTLDVGVFNQSGKSDITNDPDALTNGLVVTAAGSASLISDIANYGLQLWDFATGTADPVATLQVKATLMDAALSAAGGGTITVEIHYTLA
jgi:hypothetical protein